MWIGDAAEIHRKRERKRKTERSWREYQWGPQFTSQFLRHSHARDWAGNMQRSAPGLGDRARGAR
jgi:hypothetical protein